MGFKERYLTEGNDSVLSTTVPKGGGLSQVDIHKLFAGIKDKTPKLDDNLLHTDDTIAPGLEPGAVKHLFDQLQNSQ
jgi:hypothetical protein